MAAGLPEGRWQWLPLFSAVDCFLHSRNIAAVGAHRRCRVERSTFLCHKQVLPSRMEDDSLRRLLNLSAALEEDAGLEGTALLIVDPQVDFHEGGSLAVSGAADDAERVARLITDHFEDIDTIVVTLDSHHVRHEEEERTAQSYLMARRVEVQSCRTAEELSIASALL